MADLFPDSDDEVTDKERIEAIEREDEAEETTISAPYPCLEIISGPRAGLRVHLAGGETSIGRSSENALVLRDSSISRRHAIVHRDESGFRIKDLGSRNGVSVNGSRLAPESERVLSHLDRIAMGIYRLRLLVEEAPPDDSQDEIEDLGEPEAGTSKPPLAPAEESVQDLIQPSPTQPEPAAEPVSDALPVKAVEAGQGLEPGSDAAAAALAAREERALEEASLEADTDEGETGFSKWRFALVIGGILVLFGLAVSAWFYYRSHLPPPRSPESPFDRPTSPGDKKAPADKPGESGQKESGFNTITVPLQESSQKVTSVFINVTSEPLPAVISLSGKELGQTPLHTNIDVELDKPYTLKARYQLTDIGESFETETPFEAHSGDDTLQFNLTAELATLKFSQLPADVSVYLEASYDYDPYHSHSIKLETITYGKPFYVPYGTYVIELRGVSPARPDTSLGATQEDILYRRSFVLNKDHTAEEIGVAEKALETFPARVSSDPAKADIFYDGKKIGATPWEGDLQLGKHTLLVEKQGFKDAKREVEIWRNEVQDIAIKLETTAAGELIFQAKEAYQAQSYAKAVDLLGAALTKSPTEKEKGQAYFLLGEAYKEQGNCDKAMNYYNQAKAHEEWKDRSMLGLATCAHRLGETTQAILYLSHVFLGSKDQDLLAQAESVFHKVSPLRSVLYVNTKPTGATVFINNRQVDNLTPLILTDLSVGSYKIRIRLEGYEGSDETIHLKLSEFRPIYVELKPAQ